MSDKYSKKQEDQAVTKMQMFWGGVIMIGLIAVVISWVSSLLSGDVVEATDYFGSETVEAVTETIVSDDTQNPYALTLESVKWFDGDWISLEALTSDGSDAGEMGLESYGIRNGENIYLWLRYESVNKGTLEFFLPDEAAGVISVTEGSFGEGMNAWILRMSRADWEAIEEAEGMDTMGIRLIPEAAGKEAAFYITMPQVQADE